jgi:outer membrane receptor protein involved in Fe transport
MINSVRNHTHGNRTTRIAAGTFASLLICVFCAAAQQQAALAGRVLDADTRKPLAGATVKVVGTYYGAVTKSDGTYQIRKVDAGTYTIEVSLLGYSKVQRTGVRVAAGETLELNFELKESVLTLGQDVIIIGKRPLVDVEETQSVRSIDREQIDAAPVDDITEVVMQQPGVSVTNDEIHVRGGRAYETGFLVDGVSVQDPLAGTGFGLQLSAAAIENVEIITGGFNAEYGQATSGVVKVRTREGGERYSGSASYKRGWLLHARSAENFDVGSTFATDVGELSLGGPIPGTNGLVDGAGPITFFVNALGNYSDGIAPEFARPTDLRSTLFDAPLFTLRQNNVFNLLGKLNWNISSSFRIGYSFNQSGTVNQNLRSLQTNLEFVDPEPGYQYRFQYNPEGALTFSHLNVVHSLTLQHTLSPSTVYEAKASRYFARLRTDANGRDFSEYIEPQDIPGVPARYYETGDSNRTGIIPGDGFYDAGDGDTWHDHYFDDWSLKVDLTHVFSEVNTLKAGADVHLQQMQLADIYKPWLGPLGLNNDVYKVSPAMGALYAQDAVEFKGLILNAGLRFDYWFPGTLVDEAVERGGLPTLTAETKRAYEESTIALFGRRMKGRISPRLGVSHPITNTQMLFFNYGHFTKWPRPQLVYAKLAPQEARSSYQTFGNPNLEPETTISYELGIKNQLSEDDVLTVRLFYNDRFDYIQRRSFPYDDPRLAGRTFTSYVNADYARNRGLELEYEKRIGEWFTGGGTITYSITTGRSASESEIGGPEGAREESLREDFMPWDKPLQGRVYAIVSGRDDAPLGIELLEDTQLFIELSAESGKRYTPAVATGDVLPNGRPVYESDNRRRYSALASPKWWINMKGKKYFSFAGVHVGLTLEIENVLDALNSEIINPVTGRAYETGDPTPLSWNDPLYPDLQAPLDPYPYNPARYSNRRNLRIGIETRF